MRLRTNEVRPLHRALSGLLVLAALTPALLGRQSANPRPADGFLYYDYLEGGVLRGGMLRVDPGDPLMADQGEAFAGRASAVTTLMNNGPSSNRIDLVFVGDGYTAAEIGVYAANVNNVMPSFFAMKPLDEYMSFFNAHRVDVVSNESGVDNDPVLGVMKDTAMDMGFWCGGTQRALCISVGKARNQASNAPDVDQILALANSSTYGGVGYPTNNLGTLSGSNSSAVEIAKHEFGHSFADLADEYDYGGPTTWPGGEPAAANVSTYDAATMASLLKKWHLWLPDSNVGTFEGANYSRFGIYRPTNNSLMRNLFRPLQQVNVEQFVLSLYKEVQPIDDATPAGIYGSGTVFFVDPIDPIGHALDVQWSLDGVAIPGATGLTLDASTLGLSAGPHTISAAVVDNTPLVRDETKRAQLLREVRSWTVDDSARIVPYGCGLNPPGSMSVTSGLPQLGATVVLALANPIGTSAPGSIPVLVTSLAPDPAYPCGTPLPGFGMNPLNPGELLIDLSPGALLQPFLFGAPYGGIGAPPAQVSVSVPNDPALLGLSVFVQGVLFDPTGSFNVRIALADAVELGIGQ